MRDNDDLKMFTITLCCLTAVVAFAWHADRRGDAERREPVVVTTVEEGEL